MRSDQKGYLMVGAIVGVVSGWYIFHDMVAKGDAPFLVARPKNGEAIVPRTIETDKK